MVIVSPLRGFCPQIAAHNHPILLQKYAFFKKRRIISCFFFSLVRIESGYRKCCFILLSDGREMSNEFEKSV